MEEVEISETDKDYEVIPITSVMRLQKKVRELEEKTEGGYGPQLQGLINQIIELMRANQKLVDDVIRADAQLRNELSKLPVKIDELVSTVKSFMDLVKIAGEEEAAITPESMKPIADQFQRMVDQNQKLVESNQKVLDALGTIERKLKAGTPVSSVLSAYPRLRLREQR